MAWAKIKIPNHQHTLQGTYKLYNTCIETLQHAKTTPRHSTISLPWKLLHCFHSMINNFVRCLNFTLLPKNTCFIFITSFASWEYITQKLYCISPKNINHQTHFTKQLPPIFLKKNNNKWHTSFFLGGEGVSCLTPTKTNVFFANQFIRPPKSLWS